MEIIYEGGATAALRGDRTVVLNPLARPEKGTIALFGKRLKRGHGIVNGPGEYEIGGVLISTVHLGPRDSTLLGHAVTLDGLTVVFHNGDPEMLTSSVLETFGKVDILLLEVDNVQAGQRAVSLIDPRVSLLYGPRAPELAASLGSKDAEPKSRFNWNGISSLPKAVLLKPAATRKKAA